MRKKKENSIFSIYDPIGVKQLTYLRLQFSHLNEHKFRHDFGDTNKRYVCIRKWSSNSWTFSLALQSLAFSAELFENLVKVDSRFLSLNVKDKASFLSYGSQSASSKSSNHEILKFVIKDFLFRYVPIDS